MLAESAFTHNAKAGALPRPNSSASMVINIYPPQIKMTTLQAGDFLLRPFKATDAPAFAAAVRESMNTVGQWMSWARAEFNEQDALAWFAACDSGRVAGSSHEFGIFGHDGHTFVGGAGLNQFNGTHAFCNLGYWIRESAQRQGAALAATRLLAQHAFTRLQQSRVEIVVADGNAASVGVARKAGAAYECLARNRLILHGRPVDAHVFALLPDDVAARLPPSNLSLRTNPSASPPHSCAAPASAPPAAA
jgi:ribosomal-protein-serine acetyltransferase